MTVQDDRAIQSYLDKGTIRDVLTEWYISRDWMTTMEVARRCGFSNQKAASLLHAMKVDGEVEKKRVGKGEGRPYGCAVWRLNSA